VLGGFVLEEFADCDIAGVSWCKGSAKLSIPSLEQLDLHRSKRCVASTVCHLVAPETIARGEWVVKLAANHKRILLK
jgi:hypothetical protein